MPNANSAVRLVEQGAEAAMQIVKNLFNAEADWVDNRAGAKELIEHAFPEGHAPKTWESVSLHENIVLFGGGDDAHVEKLHRLLEFSQVPHTMVTNKDDGKCYVMAARKDLGEISELCAAHKIDLNLNTVHKVSEQKLDNTEIEKEETLEDVVLYRINNPDEYFNHSTALDAMRKAGFKANIVQTNGNVYLQVNRRGDYVDKTTGEVKTVDKSKQIEKALNDLYWLAREQKNRDVESLNLKAEFYKNHIGNEVGVMDNLTQEQLMLVMPYLQRENVDRIWERNANDKYTLTYDMSKQEAHKAILTALAITSMPKYNESMRDLIKARRAAFSSIRNASEITFFADASDESKLYKVDKDGLKVIEDGKTTLLADRFEPRFQEQTQSKVLECKELVTKSYNLEASDAQLAKQFGIKEHDTAHEREYRKMLQDRVEEIQETSDVFERTALVNARKTLGILYSDQGMIAEAGIMFADIQRLSSTGARTNGESNLSAIGRQVGDDTNGQIYEARDNLDDARDARKYAEISRAFARNFSSVEITDDVVEKVVAEYSVREDRDLDIDISEHDERDFEDDERSFVG